VCSGILLILLEALLRFVAFELLKAPIEELVFVIVVLLRELFDDKEPPLWMLFNRVVDEMAFWLVALEVLKEV